MDSVQLTDRMSAEVAKTPNRVSLDDIKANIAAEYFMTGDKALGEGVPVHPDLAVLTICILVMKNGFTIIGKAAPADPANFNAELGRNFAREDAIRQVWPLMGFALREKLRAAA